MRILLLILFCASICACVYQPDIQQGNVINPAKVARLHNGMSTTQVKQIMGNPLLQNTFANNRMNYVYTYQPYHGRMTEQRVTLTFSRGRLVKIEK